MDEASTQVASTDAPPHTVSVGEPAPDSHSLRARVLAAQREPGPACHVATTALALPADVRGDFAELADDPTVHAAALSTTIFQDYSLRISPQSIRRHRRRRSGEGCRCP